MVVRMTVTIDERVLAEAQKFLGAKTKREAIQRALEEVVRRARRRALIAHAGSVELTLTQEELRQWREEE